MQPKIFIPLLMVFSLACTKQKKISKDEIENNLKTAMKNYFYTDKKTDSTQMRFDITDMNYFDDSIKDKYICEFKVHLHVYKDNFDTTGIMKANISRDFTKVQRLDE